MRVTPRHIHNVITLTVNKRRDDMGEKYNILKRKGSEGREEESVERWTDLLERIQKEKGNLVYGTARWKEEMK